jgi:hypothetical protein
MCLIFSELKAQFQAKKEFDDDDFLYRRETMYGLNTNTISGLLGGVVIKHNRVISHGAYHFFSVEATNVRHPREVRTVNFNATSTFIFQKLNYFVPLRLQYGREQILFRKAARQGVQVSWVYAAGPTLGILAPYVIRYRNRDNFIFVEPFNPNTHETDRILGTAGFFQSVFKARIKPGISAKTSLLFEFGRKSKVATAAETGFMIDAYTQKIPIMNKVENQQVYTSLFLNFYIGRRK